MNNKYLTPFFLILFSMMLSGSKCNPDYKNNNQNMFTIPQLSKTLICKLVDNNIIVTDSIAEISQKSIVVNNEFICLIGSVDAKISIYDIKGKLIKKIDSDFNAKSLNSKGSMVYLGGKSAERAENPGEIFATLDLSDKNSELNKIKLPIDIKYGKAIDDVLILENKLILVDNIIFPKYLLEYDITDVKNPKHIKTRELENNGTHEHIKKGDINNDWMLLFSSSAGKGGSSDIIVIEGKTKGSISVYRSSFQSYDKKDNAKSINDICLIGNYLYVLLDNGLQRLDLNGQISIDNLKKVSTKLEKLNRIIKTPENKLIGIFENEYELIEPK